MAGVPQRHWSLVQLRGGQPGEAIALPEGATTIGRDPANAIPVTDHSMSRKHAEISRQGNDVRVRDLGSRNGLRVNGVPRSEALLQHGDTIEVGSTAFQVSWLPGGKLPKAALSTPETEANVQDPTKRQRIVLPSFGNDRSLSTLYHVCSWLSEELEEEDFTDKCLQVLQDGTESLEAQLYNAKGELEGRISEKESKAVIKLVPFLCERYQNLSEAISVPGRDVRKHQAAAAKFNFLIGPLRPQQQPDSGPCPFVVLVRPTEWEEFDVDDRLLLQAICQLWVRSVKRLREVAHLRSENATLRRQGRGLVLLGCSESIESLKKHGQKAARANFTVTLLGETGSGKEVMANFIHTNSPRAEGPFVKVNCAAIPPSLIESELFGHTKGSFTDARGSHRGKFEQAHKGTLFLDEIGELPVEIQAKLLRAIESGEIDKIGSEKPVIVDVRVIAASHRDLQQMVQAKQFREDLYYRLNVLPIRVPPLREHLDDVGEIAAHFLQCYCCESGMAGLEFEPDALAELQKHHWPGNVRELRNVVQRCAVHAETPTISAELVRDQLKQTS